METENRKPRSVLGCTAAGALSFLLAGIASGLVLLRFEGIIGFPVEGVVGGLLFGLFISRHFSVTRTVIASTLAITVGLFEGSLVGLFIYAAYGVPALTAGAFTGIVFGIVMRFGKRFLGFALICSVIFILGDTAMGFINVTGGPLYTLVTGRLGESGYKVAVTALTALYHGLAIGLATGVRLSVESRKKLGDG